MQIPLKVVKNGHKIRGICQIFSNGRLYFCIRKTKSKTERKNRNGMAGQKKCNIFNIENDCENVKEKEHDKRGKRESMPEAALQHEGNSSVGKRERDYSDRNILKN